MSARTEVAGRRVTVMGLGRFGGGVGVTRWLVDHDAAVTVTDQADTDALADSCSKIADLPVTLALGGHPEPLLDRTDLLVVSPAVDQARASFVQAAVARGIPLTSEMNLFLERCPARVIGVTGSAGKSTTTAMIGLVLESAVAGPDRCVLVGGNIGRSLLADLRGLRPTDDVVLELSSFQLDDLARIDAGVSVAVLTNLAPNHLDRHGTLDAYADAKMNLVRRLDPGGTLVHNADDAPLQHYLAPVLARLASLPRAITVSTNRNDADLTLRDGVVVARRSDTDEALFTAADLPVPGRHNVCNAMLAAAVGLTLGAVPEAIRTALLAFRGLPHRLELVAEIDGVRYYNDSKATTPEAALTAVAAFDDDPGRLVMIVGGDDKKQSDFTTLAGRLAASAAAVICLGRTREAIADAVTEQCPAGAPPAVALADDLIDAVRKARHHAQHGDAIVLSPACASYDMFANYEQRGQAFRSAAAE